MPVYDSRPFDWLRYKDKLQIDIWLPGIKLAIEYDGKQHFKPVKMFGGKKGLRLTQKRDKLKDQLIAQHPEDIKHFIRIKYDEPITKEHIQERLKQEILIWANTFLS
jgi:CO dehydrogenase/acetyl-CoA synthase alpha subunit